MACGIHQGGPIFGGHRLDNHHWPITFDGMHSTAGSENAPELAYRSLRIIHIDDRVSCGQPIQRLVRQRQNGTITLMCSDPIANSGRVRIFPGLSHKLRIDVQRVHMATRAHPLGDFDRRMAGTTAKIGNDMPRADICWFIKGQ